MKKWAVLLAVLNAFDGISTYIGMRFMLIGESNPILAMLPPEGILFVKIVLSLALLLLLFAVNLKRPFFKYMLIAGNSIYALLFGLHLYWIMLALIV